MLKINPRTKHFYHFFCSKTVLDWRAKGVRVIAWTVNHPLEKQHFSRTLKITYLTDTLIGEATAHLTHHSNQVP